MHTRVSYSSSCKSSWPEVCLHADGNSHRTERIHGEAKLPRLQAFIDPVKAQWQDPNLKESLKDYSGFCHLMGLDKAQEYLAKRRAHDLKDWGSASLDEEGIALQDELEQRQKVCLTKPDNVSMLTSVSCYPCDPRSLSWHSPLSD